VFGQTLSPKQWKQLWGEIASTIALLPSSSDPADGQNQTRALSTLSGTFLAVSYKIDCWKGAGLPSDTTIAKHLNGIERMVFALAPSYVYNCEHPNTAGLSVFKDTTDYGTKTLLSLVASLGCMSAWSQAIRPRHELLHLLAAFVANAHSCSAITMASWQILANVCYPTDGRSGGGSPQHPLDFARFTEAPKFLMEKLKIIPTIWMFITSTQRRNAKGDDEHGVSIALRLMTYLLEHTFCYPEAAQYFTSVGLVPLAHDTRHRHLIALLAYNQLVNAGNHGKPESRNKDLPDELMLIFTNPILTEALRESNRTNPSDGKGDHGHTRMLLKFLDSKKPGHLNQCPPVLVGLLCQRGGLVSKLQTNVPAQPALTHEYSAAGIVIKNELQPNGTLMIKMDIHNCAPGVVLVLQPNGVA
jgi:hypothetical protein